MRRRTQDTAPQPRPVTQPTPRARIVSILFSAALSLLIAGCHKKQAAAYQPPPPPASSKSPSVPSDTAKPTNPAPAPSNTAPGTTQATAPPAAQPAIPSNAKPILSEVGLASWYGPPYTNRKAADGSVFDQNAMTAAHRTLPMGSLVRVTNLVTNQTAVVRITDRGPFVAGRILDLSLGAAKATGLYRLGVAKVRIEAYNPTDRPVDPVGRWCVQIGAFTDPADAVSLKNDLIRRYSTAKVIEFPGPTGHWVRINAQNPDEATATRIANSIHLPDAEPFLVRLN
jgi:rare lipoprotein A